MAVSRARHNMKVFHWSCFRTEIPGMEERNDDMLMDLCWALCAVQGDGTPYVYVAFTAST